MALRASARMTDRGMTEPLDLVASQEAARKALELSILPENVRFLNVKSVDDSVRLASLNPFIIQKVIDGQVTGRVEFVKKLASGDLLIKVVDGSQVRDLRKLRMIHNINVVVSVPVNLNTCKGVITCRDLRDMTEADIVECMKDQDVCAAKTITRLDENKQRVRTNSVILSFAKAKVPEKINVGYERISVRPYVPLPMRCFKCQKFGHGSMRCKSIKTICGRCTGEHDSKDCKLTPKCMNCSGDHPSYDRNNCESYKLETEIITYKVNKDVSFPEARKHIMDTRGNTPVANVTYSARVVNKPTTCNVSCQTNLSVPFDQTVSFLVQTSNISTNTSDESPTPSSQSSTSEPSNSLPSSVVVEATQQPKLDKNYTSNMTVLNKPKTQHIVVPVAPSRHSSLSRNGSTEQLDMETTTAKTARNMSPGQKLGDRRHSQSPKSKKKKHNSRSPPRNK